MRVRCLSWAVLVALVFVSALRADEPRAARTVEGKYKPTMLIRLASFDRLLANFGYVAKALGKEEEAKQGVALLKNLIGDSGLEGMDTSRPMALYGRLTKGITDSHNMAMLPIADEKAFLDFLGRLGQQGEKGPAGIYKVKLPGQRQPGYYTFAHKYVYFSLGSEANLAPERLLPPEEVFGAGMTQTMTVTIDLEQVPPQQKDLALSTVSMRLGQYKEKKLPKETAAQHKFRSALIDDTLAQFKALESDGQTLSLTINIDSKKGELTMAMNLAARPGSACAGMIADFGQGKSVGGSLLSPGAAVNGVIHFALADKLKKVFEPVVDEGLDLILRKQGEEARRQLFEGVLKSLVPTVKMAEFDGGMSLHGPSEDGLYTLAMGLKVKDGAGIEKAFKDLFAKLPAEAKNRVMFDVEKSAGVQIHKVVPENLSAGFIAMLGENPLYFAVRDDALFLTAGEKALPLLKEALKAEPKTSRPLFVELSVAKLARALSRDHPGAVELAQKVFGKGQQDDRVVVVLEGGKTLQLRATIKGPVLRFAAQLDQAKKKEQ
jgi:hypothetical protein